MNSSSIELKPIGIWTAQLDYQPVAKARKLPRSSSSSGLEPSGSLKAWAEKR